MEWMTMLFCGWTMTTAVAPATQPATLKVAIVQYQVRDLDAVGTDADRLERFIRDAAGQGAKLIVAPETCFYRYEPWQRNGVTMAELAGQYEALRGRFCELAKELQVGLVIGLREPHEPQRVYNTALLLGPDGRELGKHRKIVPSNSEKSWTTASREAKPFQTPFGKVGLLICKDAKADWWKTYDDDGIDLYILIAGDDDGKSFNTFARTCQSARCHGILANQVTKQGQGRGNSAFARPDGTVTFLGGQEKTFYAEIPLPAAQPAQTAR